MIKFTAMRSIVVLLFVVGLVAIYLPGASGALYYDDYSNLASLPQAVGSGAFDFVFSGTAGPTGRPLALLSFLPHANDWPLNSVSVLTVNIAIHAINFLLLFVLGWQILRFQRGVDQNHIFVIALVSAGLWAVLPINVSTSLIAIQRMTGLSALFGLLGLNCFVAGYGIRRPALAAIFQLLTLGVFSLLAIYTKENGAVIPLYALLIDQFFFRKYRDASIYSRVRAWSLYALLGLLLIYLSPLMRDWFVYIDFRGFSIWSRVQTEWAILWIYLSKIVLPLPSSFSPFHDDVELIGTRFQIAVAGLAWLSVIAISILLRKKTILPLFAVLWFLIGHLLESSSITLELYFEHRNYLPAYGLCFALTYGLWSVSNRFVVGARVLLVLYLLVVSVMCYMTTSLWGRQLNVAVIWANDSPGSSRATQHLAVMLNKEAEARGAPEEIRMQRQLMLSYFDRNADVCEKCIAVRTQSLLYACTIQSADQIRPRYEAFLNNAANGRASMSVIDGLFPLIDLVKSGQCGDIELNEVLVLIDRLLENPAFSRKTFKVRLQFLAANAAFESRDIELARSYLAFAEKREPDGLPVLQFQVFLALDVNDYKAAAAAIERRRKYVGSSKFITAERLDSMLSEVRMKQGLNN
ncbi:hypothetical protein [Zhongshania borealis]